MSKYSEEAQRKAIELTSHSGQELDIVVDGHLCVQVGEHKETLGPGDSIYYDSGTPHGMIAVNGEDCSFYAIVLNPTGEPIPELVAAKKVDALPRGISGIPKTGYTRDISKQKRMKTVHRFR